MVNERGCVLIHFTSMQGDVLRSSKFIKGGPLEKGRSSPILLNSDHGSGAKTAMKLLNSELEAEGYE